MKNIAIYLSFALLFSGCLFRKCKTEKSVSVQKSKGDILEKYLAFDHFKSDSVGYLNYNFIKRKKSYIRKPLVRLLNDVELPVKFYNNIYGDLPDLDVVKGLTLTFESQLSEQLKLIEHRTPNTLHIKLQQPIDYKKAIALGKKNRSNWTKEVADFFGDKIVADISMINGSPLPQPHKRYAPVRTD